MTTRVLYRIGDMSIISTCYGKLRDGSKKNTMKKRVREIPRKQCMNAGIKVWHRGQMF